jgi:hypothetical protein
MRCARGLCQLITALLQLSLVSRRVATVVLSANVLSPLFVRGLLLPLLVFYDALLCAVFPLRLRHVTLTTVLPTHVLPGLPNRSLSAWLSPDPSACRTRATSQGRFWRRKSWRGSTRRFEFRSGGAAVDVGPDLFRVGARAIVLAGHPLNSLVRNNEIRREHLFSRYQQKYQQIGRLGSARTNGDEHRCTRKGPFSKVSEHCADGCGRFRTGLNSLLGAPGRNRTSTPCGTRF